MAYNQVLVSGTATQVVVSNQYRNNLIVRNIGPSVCYLGQDTNITVSNGTLFNVNDALNDDNSGRRGYLGDVWAITGGTSTTTLSWWERVVQ